LRAIYPDPIYPSAPEAQFGFHAEYKSVFVDRQQGKFLWEDSRRKKSNTPAAVSPDQALLVYAVYEGNHWLLIAANPLSGAERNTLKLTETPGDICFFPDGQSFLVALCETISVMKINAKTFKIEKSFSGRKSRLTEKVFVRINHAGTHFVYGRLGDSHAGKGVDHEALTFCSVQDDHIFRTKDGLIGFEDYISDAFFSEYDRWLLTKHFDRTVRIWETATGRCIQRFAEPETLQAIVSEGRMDWNYDFPGFTDWDESARPYLEIFLGLHSDWTEANFQNLILNLQTRGYGWLRPEGVRAKLMEMKPKDGNPRTEKTKFSLFGKKQS
jgi:WD40 repeat protein